MLKKFLQIGLVASSLILFAACEHGGEPEVSPIPEEDAAGGGTSQTTLEQRIDEQGGVTVTVTPVRFEESWDFKIDFSTHSVDLAVDPVKATQLIDSDGKVYLPLSWEGDGPGGHHRSGIIKFPPASSKEFMIKIVGVSEAEERSFQWNFEDESVN